MTDSSSSRADTIILDGPLGTELDARGVPTPLPGWSAHALETAPGVVKAIHRDYAISGATVHTTNTFRTRPAVFGDRWEELARRAVRLAREALPSEARLAGSIAPLADCYRPDASPAGDDPEGTRAQHAALARVLAEEGCDLLLCETFPHVGEAELALYAALATGLETWVSWTPGPRSDLLGPDEVGHAARRAAEQGASAVLVNCLPVARTLEYVRALVRAVEPNDVLVGAYANAGFADEATGWRPSPVDPAGYAESACAWRAAGARILGGCCGTNAEVVAALAASTGPGGPLQTGH